MDIKIRAEGVVLPATLTMPAGPVRGGVIPLHGAEAGHRSFFLYEHLSRVLPALGVALLRYDRRPEEGGADVPFSTQLPTRWRQLKSCASTWVNTRSGSGDSAKANGRHRWPQQAVPQVALLVLVSSCGVSPAQQMRIGCDKQLTLHGYGDGERA